MKESKYFLRRKEKGYTQAYVAEKAGISISTYQRLEYGGNVGIQIVEKVEKILELFKKK